MSRSRACPERKTDSLKTQSEDEKGGEVDATDAARRQADELAVKLSRLNGTGSGGRVLAQDVEKAAKQSMASSA